jgi:hypothetical protein
MQASGAQVPASCGLSTKPNRSDCFLAAATAKVQGNG